MNRDAEIQIDKETYTPGETLSGVATWPSTDRPPRKIDVRLFWHTLGKGTEDVEIVDELEIDGERAAQRCSFSFKLPVEPYSFTGSLITLQWGVEVIAGKASATTLFTMAPDGVARRLSS
jgi:hypothetical protein